ncbi:MAG: hypothetical protein AAF607_03895 [Pseudomonadota bacterium]
MGRVETQRPIADASDSEFDFYVEPQWIWDALFCHEKLWGVVVDPCCGTGTALKAAEATGMPGWCIGYDVVDRASSFQTVCRDIFDLKKWGAEGAGIMVTNPPFYKGQGWKQTVVLAKQYARYKLIMIGSDKLHYSGDRADFWAQHRPSRIYNFADRPSMPPGSIVEALGKDAFKNGAINYSAYVWDFTAPQLGTQTYWLRKDGTLI